MCVCVCVCNIDSIHRRKDRRCFKKLANSLDFGVIVKHIQIADCGVELCRSWRRVASRSLKNVTCFVIIIKQRNWHKWKSDTTSQLACAHKFQHPVMLICKSLIGSAHQPSIHVYTKAYWYKLFFCIKTEFCIPLGRELMFLYADL